MTLRKMFKLGAVGLAVGATFVGLAGAGASASTPAPVHELYKVYDKCGLYVPFRQGIYNSSTLKGFGFAKISGKHNITSAAAAINPVLSPHCGTPDGDYNLYYEYPTLYEGDEIIDQIAVEAVVNPNVEQKWYGVELDGHVGLTTEYCIGYKYKCPAWVTSALSHPGPRVASSNTPSTTVSYAAPYEQTAKTLDTGDGSGYNGQDDLGAAGDNGTALNLTQ